MNPFKPGDVCRVVQGGAFAVGSVVEILHIEPHHHTIRCRLILGEIRAYRNDRSQDWAWTDVVGLAPLEKI